jgi:GT2 family glycosyltransferase/SAM-dependent methyltransferase
VIRCSIVIPVHNRSSLTRECLDALLADLPAQAEVIVVDDASSDETPDVLASYGERIRPVSLAENRGFAGACNAGVASSSAEYVVLLNNDTRPTVGWLEALVAYADAHPPAAVIGAKLLWPDGAVQHAGVAIDADRDVRHIYAGFPGDHPAVNRARRFQVVTAACVLLRREVFESLGGLDTAFRNGYEDVDFCLRAGAAGHEVHYCPDCVVYHLESASRGYEDPTDLANRDLYKSRWADRVRHDDFSYYVEDGLLSLKYEWLSVNPEVSPLLGSAATETEGTAMERALAYRSRQCFLLIRENARLALDVDAPAPWGAAGPGVAPPPLPAPPETNGDGPPAPTTDLTLDEFMDLAGRYDRWPSGEPYDWGGASRTDSPFDNLDFHVDLGCGHVKKGRIGVDRFPAPGVNVLCDLERLRTFAVAGPGEEARPRPDGAPIHEGGLPFADGTIESIIAHHCLEHLGGGFVALMDECWRVLKPGGQFRIIVPLFPSWSAVVDPDHSRFFIADAEGHSTFDYFCDVEGGGGYMDDFAVSYTRARFEKVDQDLTRRSESPREWWTAADARELRTTLRALK